MKRTKPKEKLSFAMQTVIDRLNEGWELRVSIPLGCWIQKNARHGYVNSSTFHALRERKLIECVLSDCLTETWRFRKDLTHEIEETQRDTVQGAAENPARR